MNPGAIPEAGLRDLVGKVVDLDMEEVMKEIEQQSKQSDCCASGTCN